MLFAFGRSNPILHPVKDRKLPGADKLQANTARTNLSSEHIVRRNFES
jgi:hypothetical protein